MDANQLGPFIAERRKELGMTQAQLAEKLNVTDKAVSRWERGVGLPDINSVERLAETLEVTIVELMQAKRNESETISAQEAERLLSETIHMSKRPNGLSKTIGGIILLTFGVIIVFLMKLFFTDMTVVEYSVGSIVIGLIAWAIPIWQITFVRNPENVKYVLMSMGLATVSLILQFYDIAQEVFSYDWSALLDTINAISMVAVLFSFITIGLNAIMIKVSSTKKQDIKRSRI